jgi:hypothetical protein
MHYYSHEELNEPKVMRSFNKLIDYYSDLNKSLKTYPSKSDDFGVNELHTVNVLLSYASNALSKLSLKIYQNDQFDRLCKLRFGNLVNLLGIYFSKIRQNLGIISQTGAEDGKYIFQDIKNIFSDIDEELGSLEGILSELFSPFLR